jgi:hypothetical protein
LTDQADKKRSGRQGKRRSLDEMATIVAAARATSRPRAATLFDVSTRTIDRWEAALTAGSEPELAALVAQLEATEARKRADKLDSAYDTALTTLEGKLREATVDQLISATKMLGELRITRDSLDDDELDSADRQGPGVEEAPGATAREEAGSGAEPSSGHQASNGLRPGAVH